MNRRVTSRAGCLKRIQEAGCSAVYGHFHSDTYWSFQKESINIYVNSTLLWADQMAQQVKAPATEPENQSSIPGNHMVKEKTQFPQDVL